MATFIEAKDLAFNLQLNTFADKIGTYSALLGVTDDEVASVKKDAVAFHYILRAHIAAQTFAKGYTAAKSILLGGKGSTLGAIQESIELGTPPPMPAPNIKGRFRKLIQRIKAHQACTDAIIADLGIQAHASAFNPDKGKPRFSIKFSSGGHPNLIWKKGKFQGVEIWKDSGTGYSKLDRDMRPDYIDKTNLPATGATAIWKYKMIYILNDEIIGNWSDEVSVTVTSAS